MRLRSALSTSDRNPNQQVIARQTSVVHVEDDPIVADCIRRLILRWPEFYYAGSAANGANCIDLCGNTEPDVVLLDLGLPDMDGCQLAGVLAQLPRSPRMLAITVRDDMAFLYQIERRIVQGAIWKGHRLHAELRPALTRIASGGTYFSTEMAAAVRCARAAPNAVHKLFSDVEVSLLAQFGSGLSDLEIAAAINRSESTVHGHRQRIMSKLNLHRADELMGWAIRNGFAWIGARCCGTAVRK